MKFLNNKIMLGVCALVAMASAGAQPAMPPMPGAQAGVPQMPAAVQPQAPLGMVSPVGDVGASAGGDENRQRNVLRLISEKKAELQLLTIQAEIDKFKKPMEEAAQKAEAKSLQEALEQAKKEQMAAQPQVAAEPVIPMTVLSTFSSTGSVKGYAELKVGDLMVHAYTGDRLPNGMYVIAINFDSVEVSKSKNAKKGEKLFVSPVEAAQIYNTRAKSGVAEGGVMVPSGSPLSLPPMPSNR